MSEFLGKSADFSREALKQGVERALLTLILMSLPAIACIEESTTPRPITTVEVPTPKPDYCTGDGVDACHREGGVVVIENGACKCLPPTPRN